MSSLIPGHRLVLDPDAWQILSARRTLLRDSIPMATMGSFYPVEIACPPRAELDAEFRWLDPHTKLPGSPIGAMFMVEGIVYRVVHAEVEILAYDLCPHLHIHAKSIWFDPAFFSTAPSSDSDPKTLQPVPKQLPSLS